MTFELQLHRVSVSLRFRRRIASAARKYRFLFCLDSLLPLKRSKFRFNDIDLF